MRRDGDGGDHRQQCGDIGMAAEQQHRETGEQHVLARDIGQPRQDQLECGEQHPPFERDLGQREVPQQRGQHATAERADKMRAERPAQQGGRQMEQLAAKQQRDERWREHQRDRGRGGPTRNVEREQTEIGKSQRRREHRRDVARHRREDRDVLDGAQAILAGDAVVMRPAVEIGVADIAGHQLVADLLARERHQSGERQAPDAAIDGIVGGDRRDIDSDEDEPENRIARDHRQHGVHIEQAQCEERGAKDDQRDRGRDVAHRGVERRQPVAMPPIECA
ncbi:hypothetical protein BH10PSE14_BH10PSE14_07250 [soil metagenome]